MEGWGNLRYLLWTVEQCPLLTCLSEDIHLLVAATEFSPWRLPGRVTSKTITEIPSLPLPCPGTSASPGRNTFSDMLLTSGLQWKCQMHTPQKGADNVSNQTYHVLKFIRHLLCKHLILSAWCQIAYESAFPGRNFESIPSLVRCIVITQIHFKNGFIMKHNISTKK